MVIGQSDPCLHEKVIALLKAPQLNGFFFLIIYNSWFEKNNKLDMNYTNQFFLRIHELIFFI